MGRQQAGFLVQACEDVRWKGRDAVRLTNGVIELIILTGGGHLAGLRFIPLQGEISTNVLFEAPWATHDPGREWSKDLTRIYGKAEIGKFLASYTGHALCLDYFGEPSQESISLGLSLHGAAAITQWRTLHPATPDHAHCGCLVELPTRQLSLERDIRLVDEQSVVYVQETVSNGRDEAYLFDWVQHVTFGPPFLRQGRSTLMASAWRGITWEHAYEGGALLTAGSQFMWPFASREEERGVADLRQPFLIEGRSFLAGTQLDPARETEFILAVNWESRLGVGYCFRRCDFPWMAVWEENHSRQNSPWNGTTAARGMEFGTTPLPFGERGVDQRRRVFDIPTGCEIPARGKKTAKYLIFLFRVPLNLSSIDDVAVVSDAIALYDNQGNAVVSIPADGCEAFLARDGEPENGYARVQSL